MKTRSIMVTLYGQTVVGQRRSNDEDAFLVSDLGDTPPIQNMTSPVTFEVKDRGILVAVSDGMGGARAGEVASSLVLHALWQGMSTVRASGAAAALRDTIEETNERVFATAHTTGRAGMGATLTAVLFCGAHVYIAEIGDSRAYLLRGGCMLQLTHDQTYSQQLIDLGGLSKEEAEKSEFSGAILQAMGLSSDISIALNRISLRRNDRFLVCSDGLTGALDDRAIQDIILGAATLPEACAELIETAVRHGAEDDITVVLAAVEGEGASALTDPERLAFDTSRAVTGDARAQL